MYNLYYQVKIHTVAMLVLEAKFKKALEMPLSYFEMSDLINIYVLNFGIVNF